MDKKYWRNYLIFLILFLFSQLSGCGCENTYALRASKKELKETSQLLDKIADKIDEMSLNISNLTPDKMYNNKRDIEKKINKIKLVLYWSKNIDLVLDNDWIISELKDQKARLKGLEKDFTNLKSAFAQKVRGSFKPKNIVNNDSDNYDNYDESDDNSQDENYSDDNQTDDTYYDDNQTDDSYDEENEDNN